MVYYNLLFPDSKEEPKSKTVAHPDLQLAMDQLKLYYATMIDLLEGWDFARDNIKNNLEASALAKQGHERMLDRCEITGLTFGGEGETYGVTIKGYLKFSQKGGTGVSAPKMVFNKEVFGFENDVLDLVEEVKKEVYAYRFQHKKAQLDIETEIEKEEEPELFEKP